jgi:hypothetical protein
MHRTDCIPGGEIQGVAGEQVAAGTPHSIPAVDIQIGVS